MTREEAYVKAGKVLVVAGVSVIAAVVASGLIGYRVGQKA
jgi:diphthamide biosynthesis methyltransferase